MKLLLLKALKSTYVLTDLRPCFKIILQHLQKQLEQRWKVTGIANVVIWKSGLFVTIFGCILIWESMPNLLFIIFTCVKLWKNSNNENFLINWRIHYTRIYYENAFDVASYMILTSTLFYFYTIIVLHRIKKNLKLN